MRRFLLAVLLIVGTAFGFSPVLTASATSDKVTLCHATGSDSNPFVTITVATAAAYNGHLGAGHQGGEDIIPPFEYDGGQYSQNWDAEGMATFTNGCTPVIPEVPPTEEPTEEPPTEEPTEEPPTEEPEEPTDPLTPEVPEEPETPTTPPLEPPTPSEPPSPPTSPETPEEPGTRSSPDEPTVTVQHRYTCVAHVRRTFENGVLIDREVFRYAEPVCEEGGNPEEQWAEEGM